MLSELVVNELQELQEEHQGFKIDSLESANWAFRKLHALKEQQNEYELLAQKEHERIEKWLYEERERIENQKAFFEGFLTEYAIQERQKNPKFEISSPYGKVTFRKQQPKWNYEDSTVLESLKRSNMLEFIRVKEEVNKSELKKAVNVVNGRAVIADTGEIVEGITVEEQPEAIKIEVI